MTYKLPLEKSISKYSYTEKSGQKHHFRTSKTGKVYSAGKGRQLISEEEILNKKIDEASKLLDKDPKKYAKFFHISGMKEDLIDRLDSRLSDDARSKAIDEIEDMSSENALDEWLYHFAENDKKWKEELDFAAENYIAKEEK